MTFYRDLLRQAMKSAWSYKYLWFFGLFATFLGSMGEFELIFRGFNADNRSMIPGLDGITESGLLSGQGFRGMGQFIQSEPLSFFLGIGILLLVLALGLFFLWLAVCSESAIVHSASRIRLEKPHDMKSSLGVGMAKFWPVFSLNLFFRLAMYALFTLLSLPIIMLSGKTSDLSIGILYLVLFVIFVILMIILSFIAKYAIAFVVIKEARFAAAVKQAWNLFLKNWLISLEMAFFLFFINFVIGAGIILLFLILGIPFFFMAYMFVSFQLFFSFWLIVIIAMIVYLGIIILAGSILSVFQIGSWTALFMELISRGGVSKLVRVFSKE